MKFMIFLNQLPDQLVCIFIFILAVDVGNMYLTSRMLDNINYIAIDYAIDHINDESLSENMSLIINNNDDKIEINDFLVNDNKIYINTSKDYNGIFIGLIKNKMNIVKSSYVGYMADDKKVIERNKQVQYE